MTNRKNSRLVTMELDLEAYKVKNKCLSEHLTKVQHEKAQAYQELNNLRQQYWKLYRKYCSIKSIIRDNMKDNINLLTNHQEKLKKFFTEENGSSAESSMKSNESRNRTASLYDNRSQRSALNSNERSFDSVTEGISTRVVTTRKKYNSDKENSVRDTASINENISPAYSGVDSSPRMAEVQVNIRKRKEPTEDDGRRGGEGPDQDLWDVDVRLKGDDTNTNRSLDTSDDAEEDDEEKLDTIQEEDEEIGYWTESAKRLKLMVTERRLGPDAAVDEDSSMICQLDETVIDRTNALEVSPVERRRRMADKYNHSSNVSTSMDLDAAADASTAKGSTSVNVHEDSLDLSNSNRLFMMKALNLKGMSNADTSRNDISFKTSTPFAEISPRLRTRPERESSTPTSPRTIVDRGSTTSSACENNSSTTLQPKRIFSKTEKQSAKTSGQSIDGSTTESSSSGITLKRGSCKKLPNVVVPIEQKTTNKTELKSKSKDRDEEREESDVKIKGAVPKKHLKINRKANIEEIILTQSKVDKEITTRTKAKHVDNESAESSRDNSSISDSDEVEESVENDETTSTSSGDETLTQAGTAQQRGGSRTTKQLNRVSSEDNNKIIRVILDRADVERYSASTASVPVPVEMNSGQLSVMGTSDISSGGEERQSSATALKKVKRRKQIVVMKDSPRPTRAARPTKPLCESNLKDKMRRSR